MPRSLLMSGARARREEVRPGCHLHTGPQLASLMDLPLLTLWQPAAGFYVHIPLRAVRAGSCTNRAPSPQGFIWQ